MGIYDREYYRREGPSFLESISRWGIVCKWLIAVNVFIYIAQLTTRERLMPAQFADAFEQIGVMARGNSPVTEALLLDVPKVLDGQVWRLLTYAFLHDPNSPWHIIFNMLALWWFGTKVEDVYHWKEFLAFYLTAAIFGGLAFMLAYLANLNGPKCLGASAAVMAVMMVCACLYPTDTILIFWVLPVPIWLAMVLYVAWDFTGLLGGIAGSRVAFSGHLGGAAFGYLYWYWQLRITNLLPDFNAWRRERARPNLRIYREEEGEGVPQVVPAGGGGGDGDEHFEAKQDAILEKIHRFGQNSLTDGEREFMKKAAERAQARVKSKKKPSDQE